MTESEWRIAHNRLERAERKVDKKSREWGDAIDELELARKALEEIEEKHRKESKDD